MGEDMYNMRKCGCAKLASVKCEIELLILPFSVKAILSTVVTVIM